MISSVGGVLRKSCSIVCQGGLLCLAPTCALGIGVRSMEIDRGAALELKAFRKYVGCVIEGILGNAICFFFSFETLPVSVIACGG